MVEGVVDDAEALAEPGLLDRSTASALKRSELVAKPSGSTKPTISASARIGASARRACAQTVQPFLVREAIGDVVDRAEHQRGAAARA